MQKITPFLWFNNNAQEAVYYYISIFKNSRIVSTMPGPDGTVMGISFILDGQEFQALNGGPQFKFTEAISLFVRAETQPEIDELWEKLSAGGEKSMCGWLKDKFGLSWQIVPPILGQLLSGKDRDKSQRVMTAMLKMDNINIQALLDAWNQE